MAKIRWIGDTDEYIRAFEGNDIETLSDYIQENQDYITTLSLGETDYEELSKTLQYGFMMLDDFKEKSINDDIKRIFFEIGCLYGLMQLSSHICYEKKKEYRISESAVSYSRIKHFDDIISSLEDGQEMSHAQLGERLGLNASTLTECMKKVMRTNMIQKRRSGKYILYSLSDNGLRYAKIHRQESNQYHRSLMHMLNSMSERIAELEATQWTEIAASDYKGKNTISFLPKRKSSISKLARSIFIQPIFSEIEEENKILDAVIKRRESVSCANRF